MATTLAGQFASNMLLRTFVFLPLCGFLIVCDCTVLRRNAYQGVSMQVDCDQNGSSTECASRISQNEIERGQMGFRASRKMGEEDFNGDDSVDDEATSRKKKDKGYGKMLMYFLGASKLTMLYVLINTVAAIAGKALVVGKVALAIATAILLKKSFEHKEDVLYEIIKHPHHTYEHKHSSSIDYGLQSGFGEHDFSYRKRRRIYS